MIGLWNGPPDIPDTGSRLLRFEPGLRDLQHVDAARHADGLSGACANAVGRQEARDVQPEVAVAHHPDENAPSTTGT